ncbi:putative ABC-type xenobiotic transporter [Helianthus annuus]|nr:putative ABC-type xenobiotic transporter [Helianthus annuus]
MQIFNQARAAGKQVFEVINRKSAISYDGKGKTLDKIHGTIEIRDVHFAYPSRQEKLILQGFSLYIPTGKVVALVGSSGCGKSTIISLVPRFYDPEKGLHPPTPRVGKMVGSGRVMDKYTFYYVFCLFFVQ